MKKYLLLLLCFLSILEVSANENPCKKTDSLVISTGLQFSAANPLGTVVTVPGIDPYWQITAVSTLMQQSTLTPTFYANVLSNLPTTWYNNLPNSQWISSISSGQQLIDNNLDSGMYWSEYSRDFRVCGEDTFNFNFNLSNDDGLDFIMIDNSIINLSGLPQPNNYPSSAYFSGTINYQFQVVLGSGWHRLTLRVQNYISPNAGNAHGINLAGAITSATQNSTLFQNYSDSNCVCNNPTNDTTTSSVKALQKENISIYPNPTKNNLVVDFPESGDLAIINQLGQVVNTTKILNKGKQTIQLEYLPTGMYFIRFTGKSKTYLNQFIKQ